MSGVIDYLRRYYFTRGGVHPRQNKRTASIMVFPGPRPEQVTIPLLQHTGAPCEPMVEVGDRVLVGQKIGDSEAYISAPVHSSVSGEVSGIINHPHPTGKDVLSIQIVSDGRDELSPEVKPPGDPFEMRPEEIRRAIREAGIVGLGGAAFPTHVKLAPPPEKSIKTLIINGAECEPYLTADHRLMIERSKDIVKGALIIKRVLEAEEVIIAIEGNKRDAIQRMREAGQKEDVHVVVLPTRYPMGAEKTLIRTLTGREVPSGGLPSDVGVVVNNVGTAAAICELFEKGMPLIERIVTVCGDGVAGNANLRVKIGTLAKDVIDFCGGYVGGRGKLIFGGPMMGLAQYADIVPVVKGTSGILVLRYENLFIKEPAHFTCIRCGRCVRYCPMNLMPFALGMYADTGIWEKLEQYNVNDCVECGCCAYVCPTKNPLVQLMKVGKEGLARRKKKMEELEQAISEEEGVGGKAEET